MSRFFAFLALGLLAILVLFALSYVVLAVATIDECLAMGYPEGRISSSLKRYCQTTYAQTAVVVPLGMARAVHDIAPFWMRNLR